MIDAIIVKIKAGKTGLLTKVAAEIGSGIQLNAKDIASLKELCSLLEPLTNATVRLEADSIPTSGMVLPITMGSTMPYGLINAISHRLAYVQSGDRFVLSSVLEPRFRLKWTSSQAEEMAAKSLVIEHMDKQQQQQPTEQGITDCMFAQDELFGFMSSDDTSTRKSSTVVELDSYLADASNTEALTFWAQHKQQYPRLYKLHLKHHSEPATSAAMERCFSADGYIASARPSSLSDDMLEAMLIAKCNKDFL